MTAVGELAPGRIQRLGPIWPRLPRCPGLECRALSWPHRGQHGGLRHYACPKCGRTWTLPPLGWRALVDGEEVLLPDEATADEDLPDSGNLPLASQDAPA